MNHSKKLGQKAPATALRDARPPHAMPEDLPREPRDSIQDAASSPNLGDEGGAGLEQIPAHAPSLGNRAKKTLGIGIGIGGALILILPLTHYEPQVYIAALIITVAAVPLAGLFARKAR